MGRKPKNGKEKSAQELMTAYTTKVSHAVQRIDDWADKIVKLAKSKKYQLNATAQQKVLENLAQKVDEIRESFEATEEAEEKEKFTL